MDLLKSNYHIIGTALFVLAIVVAQVFSSNHYDWTKNTISDLGAQGYERKMIMQTGFLAFGLTLSAGILLNGLTWRTSPILVYALCVGLTGIFCTKPFVDVETYSLTEAATHSALAQIAGFAFTAGILAQLFSASSMREKFLHLVFFVLVIGFSASFGLVSTHRGIFQRLLYLTSFLWLIKYYKP